jgi:hypothetical protein
VRFTPSPRVDQIWVGSDSSSEFDPLYARDERAAETARREGLITKSLDELAADKRDYAAMLADAQERSNGMTRVIPPTFAAFQQHPPVLSARRSGSRNPTRP